MNRIITRLFVLSFLSISMYSPASGQQAAAPLKQQYTDVVMKAGLYNGYRAIRQENLNQLWQNIEDTLAAGHQKLDELNSRLIAAEQEAAEAKLKADSISRESTRIGFTGAHTDRFIYNLIVWLLIAGLILALVIIIGRSRLAVREAKYRSELYEELTAEFHDYKSKANKKEIRLARELQTERNKVEELKGSKH